MMIDTTPKRKDKNWSNVGMALGTGTCKFCKRLTHNVLHISRFSICGDCAYRRIFKK